LFPTTSQYANEIDTLLLEVKDNVGYFKGFLSGEFTTSDFQKLTDNILENKFDGETGRKVKRLGRLGINRSNEWSNKAAELFNQKLDEGKNFKEAWPPAVNRSYRYKRIMETLLVLGQAQIRIQIGKFMMELREAIPEIYDLNGVIYIESVCFIGQKVGMELFRRVLSDWTRNVKKLWKSLPESRPAIRSHGKFWLKFGELIENTIRSTSFMHRPEVVQLVRMRDSIIKNFFERPIFGIKKKKLNHCLNQVQVQLSKILFSK
jgi:hypothetical protein